MIGFIIFISIWAEFAHHILLDMIIRALGAYARNIAKSQLSFCSQWRWCICWSESDGMCAEAYQLTAHLKVAAEDIASSHSKWANADGGTSFRLRWHGVRVQSGILWLCETAEWQIWAPCAPQFNSKCIWVTGRHLCVRTAHCYKWENRHSTATAKPFSHINYLIYCF